MFPILNLTTGLLAGTVLFILLGLAAPAIAKDIAIANCQVLITPTIEMAPATPFAPIEADEPTDRATPIKTYFLPVPPEGILHRINFNPPATKIIVSSDSGDTIVRCGNRDRAYRCQPGNPLEITQDTETPIDSFWAQNSGDNPVRLRIDVYQ